MLVKPLELKQYCAEELPTESNPHALRDDHLPTEYYEHLAEQQAQKQAAASQKMKIILPSKHSGVKDH